MPWVVLCACRNLQASTWCWYYLLPAARQTTSSMRCEWGWPWHWWVSCFRSFVVCHPAHLTCAQRNALVGEQLSGRTLVLPRFRCPRCGVGCAPESDEPNECTLQAWVYVRDLDASGIDYREASFFSHPLVPAALREVATGTTEKEGLTSIVRGTCVAGLVLVAAAVALRRR